MNYSEILSSMCRIIITIAWAFNIGFSIHKVIFKIYTKICEYLKRDQLRVIPNNTIKVINFGLNEETNQTD